MLQRLKADGITILVSTPYMDEASLCDRIALIQEGEILSVNTPDAIENTFPNKLFSVKSSSMSDLLKDLRTYTPIKSCFAFGAEHHITFHDDDLDQLTAVQKYLMERNHVDIVMKEVSASIEDCFIDLMHKNE